MDMINFIYKILAKLLTQFYTEVYMMAHGTWKRILDDNRGRGFSDIWQYHQFQKYIYVCNDNNEII